MIIQGVRDRPPPPPSPPPTRAHRPHTQPDTAVLKGSVRTDTKHSKLLKFLNLDSRNSNVKIPRLFSNFERSKNIGSKLVNLLKRFRFQYFSFSIFFNPEFNTFDFFRARVDRPQKPLRNRLLTTHSSTAFARDDTQCHTPRAKRHATSLPTATTACSAEKQPQKCQNFTVHA